MKLYQKNELKHSRVFYDQTPPRFGRFFVYSVFMILILSFIAASLVVKPYIIKAEGVVTSSDNQYIASAMTGNIVEIKAVEGSVVQAMDTLLVISNGQENIQTSAIQKQIETLNQKESALNKFVEALESGTNTLNQSGFEIEYYGKIEYYLTQVRNEMSQTSQNQDDIKKKEAKKKAVSDAILQLERDLERLKQTAKHDDTLTQEEAMQSQMLEIEGSLETKRNELDGIEDGINQLEQQSKMTTQSESMKLQLISEAGQTMTLLATQRSELEGQLAIASNQDHLFEVKAMTDGEVHYLSPIYPGLGLQQNQVFAQISTNNENTKTVEVYVPSYERSKVKVNQAVKVSVLGVNASQYGMLRGYIASIENGTITQETRQGNELFYRTIITIDDFELTDGHGESIVALPSMPVQAQIIYDSETYLMWILEMLRLK